MDCQPTYEELKRFSGDGGIVVSRNCQPTYEELKQEKKALVVGTDSDCQPTYEELKHVILLGTLTISVSLPAYL